MRWLPGRRVGVVTLANATYAPMGELSQRMLGVLADHDLVPPAETPRAPALRRAAEQLVAVLNDWDDAAADRLFADNVALDEPYSNRAAAAAELVASHGSLHLERLDAESATEGAAVLRGATGTVRVDIMLTPLATGCIERYTIRQ